MFRPRIHPNFLRPGSIVTVPIKSWLGIPRHYGIVTPDHGPDGLPVVATNSLELGGPGEQYWTDFTQDQPYEHAYYPSRLSSEWVLYNAYRMFGTRYHVLSWNCEHYANVSHGLPARSTQVEAGALATLLGGLALVATKS